MKEYIAKVVDGKDLTEEEAKKAMEIMLSGEEIGRASCRERV